ncbi:MAG: diacylglycerol kinase family protein [Burkholderiaceae bacterium]|nr:diacylglycerol kinase family protein [Burkholderiaceae bacterium]
MPDSIPVIVNSAARSGQSRAQIEALPGLFERAGLRIRLIDVRGGVDSDSEIDAALAGRPSMVVAGGGDGTLSAIAARLVDTGIPLGVLPLGTLNHFAKDLRIPLLVDDAVRVIAAGHTTDVDVGEVNGRIFINNSGLGLYPDIVRHRDRQQRTLGRSKWHALAWATWSMLRRYPFVQVRLVIDGQAREWRTPFVFVGNNPYVMEGLRIGGRSRIDEGRLCLYVAQRPGRLRLLWLALRALFGRLRQSRDFDALTATELLIETRRKRLHVATDGEVWSMATPLRYRVRPGALRVIVPASADSCEPGASSG